MSNHRNGLVTPVHVKTRPGWIGPAEGSCYYLLTRSGLFIGRNHPHARSLVPAPSWPAELESQEPLLDLRLPRVPADVVARITGFFRVAASRHGAEAIVLLAMDGRGSLRTIVPQQVAIVGRGYNERPYPISLRYAIPDLGGRMQIVGDIHSHAQEAAYASSLDVDDERYRPGLHIVAGRMNLEQPEWHAEYVVDGARFALRPGEVLELDAHATRGAAFSPRWLGRLQVEEQSRWSGSARWR
jgi:proteasome lid subunit RPN8/RPN11